MKQIKRPDEIEKMKAGGLILSRVMDAVLKQLKPGVPEIELDNLAEKLIRKNGAEPAFQRVDGYKHSICVSVNDVVVHGIPTASKIKEGDIVGIDCGVYYEGFNTDMSETIRVSSQKSEDIEKFLKTGRKALKEGINAVRAGNRVGHISKAIQDIVEGSGYRVVRSLVGHGVGKYLHEDPEIPGFLDVDINSTQKLSAGMTIAVEVIYNMGSEEVFIAQDGWTIRTRDGSLSGLFERTVLVNDDMPTVLTPLL